MAEIKIVQSLKNRLPHVAISAGAASTTFVLSTAVIITVFTTGRNSTVPVLAAGISLAAGAYFLRTFGTLDGDYRWVAAVYVVYGYLYWLLLPVVFAIMNNSDLFLRLWGILGVNPALVAPLVLSVIVVFYLYGPPAALETGLSVLESKKAKSYLLALVFITPLLLAVTPMPFPQFDGERLPPAVCGERAGPHQSATDGVTPADGTDGPSDTGGTIDTDGDGLVDSAERASSGPLAAADPNRYDIFVEVDYRGTADAERIKQATTAVQKRFDQAPIDNPDGSTGIDLHIRFDDRIHTVDEVDLDDVSPGGYISEQCRDYRGAGYHYAVVSMGGSGGTGSYGRFVVRGSSPRRFSFTFMHELGHSLGIDTGAYHGVDSSEVSYETYPSVMNYNHNFTDTGLRYNDGDPFDDWAFIAEGYTPLRGGGECQSNPYWCPIA
jgi:hypothetical protein